MFRAAPRLIARPVSLRVAVSRPASRFLSTAPPTQKSRSWKSLFARLGVAGGLIYYYNANDLFDGDSAHSTHTLPTPESDLPTIESITAERERRRAIQAQLDAQRQREEEAAAAAARTRDGTLEASTEKSEGGLEGLEEEAGQQGAFNPETGEINWDCPCLGGMAHGPCGDEFRTAFSCFVFSEEEPKGMDCIDKFKNMQNCFRQYPEVYGSELESDADDDDEADELSADVASPPSPASSATDAQQPKSTSTQQPSSTPTKRPQTTERAAQAKTSPEPPSKPHSPEKVAENRRELGLVPENYRPKEEPVSESKSLVPKAAHDASDAKAESNGKKSVAGEKR